MRIRSWGTSWTAFLPSTASVLLTIFSIWLATTIRVEEKKSKLFYWIHQDRTRIVDVTGYLPQGLEVYRDTTIISQTNVTAAFVYLWNAGSTSIKKSDVRDELAVTLQGSREQFWEGNGDWEESSPLVGYRTSAGSSLTSLLISFESLRPGDWIAGTIVYTGDPDIDIRVTGEGFEFGAPKRMSPAGILRKKQSWMVMLVVISPIPLLLGWLLAWRTDRNPRGKYNTMTLRYSRTLKDFGWKFLILSLVAAAVMYFVIPHDIVPDMPSPPWTTK